MVPGLPAPSPSAVQGRAICPAGERVELTDGHTSSTQTPVGGGNTASTPPTRRCAWVGPPSAARGLVHVWSTSHRNRAVRSGLQRYIVRSGDRRDPGETDPVQNPDKDEVVVGDSVRSDLVACSAGKGQLSGRAERWTGVTSPSHHLTTPRAASVRRRAGLFMWLQG